MNEYIKLENILYSTYIPFSWWEFGIGKGKKGEKKGLIFMLWI